MFHPTIKPVIRIKYSIYWKAHCRIFTFCIQKIKHDIAAKVLTNSLGFINNLYRIFGKYFFKSAFNIEVVVDLASLALSRSCIDRDIAHKSLKKRCNALLSV